MRKNKKVQSPFENEVTKWLHFQEHYCFFNTNGNSAPFISPLLSLHNINVFTNISYKTVVSYLGGTVTQTSSQSSFSKSIAIVSYFTMFSLFLSHQ